jgi:DNA-binding NarL/FixJ family response regulator
MSAVRRIRVLLAEDHTIVREGLRTLLEVEKDIEVVGEAANGRKVVAMAAELAPDVIIMDIAMPLLNGLEATRQIHLANPAARVLILSAHGDDAYFQGVLSVGVAGYLVKQTSAHILSVAIRAIHRGETYFSPGIANKLRKQRRESISRLGFARGKAPTLTPREAEVLQLIAEGKANKETAAELGISIKTVEKHRSQLMRKLDIHDTAGLTRFAIATGVIESTVHVTIL